VASDLTIRRFERGDAERVRELDERALREVNAYVDDPAVVKQMHPDGKETFDEDLYDIEGRYLDAGGEFLVGLVDGEIVAMGALERESDARAKLTRVRVQPEYQRRGFGQAILDELEARAMESGFEELVLDTTARQEAARAFYEANGYVEFQREQWGQFDVRHYRRSLGRSDS
jgi:ribosomal protein S18 acetylase RimI-like enzyme